MKIRCYPQNFETSRLLRRGFVRTLFAAVPQFHAESSRRLRQRFIDHHEDDFNMHGSAYPEEHRPPPAHGQHGQRIDGSGQMLDHAPDCLHKYVRDGGHTPCMGRLGA